MDQNEKLQRDLRDVRESNVSVNEKEMISTDFFLVQECLKVELNSMTIQFHEAKQKLLERELNLNNLEVTIVRGIIFPSSLILFQESLREELSRLNEEAGSSSGREFNVNKFQLKMV